MSPYNRNIRPFFRKFYLQECNSKCASDKSFTQEIKLRSNYRKLIKRNFNHFKISETEINVIQNGLLKNGLHNQSNYRSTYRKLKERNLWAIQQ